MKDQNYSPLIVESIIIRFHGGELHGNLVFMTCSRFLSHGMAAIVVALGMAVAPGGAMGQRPLGIDVSSYQGSGINWTNVKNAGYTFAWAKAAEGTLTDGWIGPDADFTINEANAKAAGVLIGAYYFAHPETDTGTAGADTEAAYFWSVAKSYITNGGAYLMPMLDYETAPGGTQAASAQWVNEWCQDIVNYAAANGVAVKPVVYTYISFASAWLEPTNAIWPLWMANPNGLNPLTGDPNATSPWGAWNVWQYGQLVVPGVPGTNDVDVFDGTAAELTATMVIGNSSVWAPPGATIYWDPGARNASPGSGGAGTWEISTPNWWLSGTGDVHESTASDAAVFAGTAGPVTLAADVGATGLTFDTAGYVLSGNHTLTLIGTTPVISVPAGSPTYIECVLGGPGYEITGGGVVVLTNPGNYSGSSTSAEFVNGPGTTLVVETDHDTGDGGVTLNLENGGIYQDNDTTSGDQFLLSGSAIALLTGGGIFDNPNANLTMANFITGPGSLTIIGTTYTLTLTDTGNNYSGGTLVQSGELKANAAGTLGSTSGPLTVSGGVLDLGGASHTVGKVTISGGTIQDGTLTGSSYTGKSGTVSAVLAGAGALNQTGSGTLTLSGANTYRGNTTVSAGVLALGSAGSINNSPLITVAAGATFDVSAISSYALSGATTLSASGASAVATIKGGATVSLGSQPIILAYDGSHPALTISQGALSLNGNAFTVNGSQLAGGNYTIVQQASGNIAGSGTYSVSGTAVSAPGATAGISISGGNVILTVTDATTTTLNPLTPSTYGQFVTLTATVAPTPAGGTVQFFDNGVALGGPVMVSGGTASYTTNTLAVGNHPITASYSGTIGYAASSTANASTQQVALPPNSVPVTISATLLANGAVQLNFAGVPGYTYYIQDACSLNPSATWTNLSTNVADINGLFNFTDLSATNYGDRYYRTTTQ
jgi:autotransporter-associated beta strand protein